MTSVAEPNNRDRAIAFAAAAAVQLAFGYALIAGLAVDLPAAIGETLKMFAVAPPPPPPSRIVPKKIASKRPEGAAAPPNIRSKATEIVAPPPIVVVTEPPPIVAATKPGLGAEATAGAAPVRGPGTGAGGIGDGTGSGGSGDGDGGGYGDETAPRQIKGRIKGSDYPRAAAEADITGMVSVRYVVDTRGRVPECEITHSSGSAILDDATCRVIMERFRFDPSRDGRGRPVNSVIVQNHDWGIERVAADRR